MNRIYIAWFLALLIPTGDFHTNKFKHQLYYDPSTLLKALPTEIHRDPYVKQLLKSIDNWNKATIKFPAFGELRKDYNIRLTDAVKHKWHGYESTGWADVKLRHFDQLTEKPKHPKLKLSRQAALTLSLVFTVNLPSIRAKCTPKTLEDELTLSIYPVFIEAQDRALKEKHPYITSEDISLTIFSWWTTIWPLCAPPGNSAK